MQGTPPASRGEILGAMLPITNVPDKLVAQVADDLDMDAAEIDAYIATGEPLHCAGSFTIDGLGGAFIRKVDGDPHTVVGLSVSTLRGLLAQAQVRITELWPAS
jgi:predicted house-cleaning NTP pyrophosphatase (Maf/HAM1 superfamily)